MFYIQRKVAKKRICCNFRPAALTCCKRFELLYAVILYMIIIEITIAGVNAEIELLFFFLHDH